MVARGGGSTRRWQVVAEHGELHQGRPLAAAMVAATAAVATAAALAEEAKAAATAAAATAAATRRHGGGNGGGLSVTCSSRCGEIDLVVPPSRMGICWEPDGGGYAPPAASGARGAATLPEEHHPVQQ